MRIKKLLSYVWPQTQKVVSEYNGTLEITFINGKKVLDSKNANYSYGSLQEILEIGVSKVDLNKVDTVLLLGLGGGSLIGSLRTKFNFEKEITAVELDAEIIKIAKTEFLIDTDNCLKIVNNDAFNFVENAKEVYDLIVIDLFIDQKVPQQFYSEPFCNHIYNRMSLKGQMVFNLGMTEDEEMDKVVRYFKKRNCNIAQYNKVLKTNTLLVASKK